ncbi:hypothetical protein [Cereibacter johrii]|uniref:hypothetical protein n=1 Tax=Cereibacter johrii TaxID=445629 RepID=UPI000DCCCC34|nr:hypothetical protein [Cereibacter johrii]RAZ83423.1 hypothetical protein DDV93_14025 [Cereibacter johrii]
MKFLVIANILDHGGMCCGHSMELGIVEDLEDAAELATRAGLEAVPDAPLYEYTDHAPYRDEEGDEADAVAYLVCTMPEE